MYVSCTSVYMFVLTFSLFHCLFGAPSLQAGTLGRTLQTLEKQRMSSAVEAKHRSPAVNRGRSCVLDLASQQHHVTHKKAACFDMLRPLHN